MKHPLHGNELHFNGKSLNQALEWYDVKFHSWFSFYGQLKCENCAKIFIFFFWLLLLLILLILGDGRAIYFPKTQIFMQFVQL